MKKLFIKSLFLVLLISSFFLAPIKENSKISSLALIQKEALADGEIIVGPLCAFVNMQVCHVEPDGLVLLGVRVY